MAGLVELVIFEDQITQSPCVQKLCRSL